MQDKYVGYVGDFGKYGLLNHIYVQSKGNINIGINWYKNTKEEKNNDGKLIDFLKDDFKHKEKFCNCFPELYEKLKLLVEAKKRNLHAVEISQILPENTIFYSEDIPFLSPIYKNREEERVDWFKRSVEHLKKAGVIFVDPDTGIQKDTVRKTQVEAVKYIFWDEIKKYYEEGKSVIKYNHRDRSAVPKHNEKLLRTNNLFEEKIDFRVLRFSNISVRDYIFLIQPAHKNFIDSTFDTLTKKPYDFMFKEYYPEIKK